MLRSTRCAAPEPPASADWEAVGGPALCRLPVGGAGRVRWWYPRPGRVAEVRERFADMLGPDALVLTRDRLVDLGLVARNGALVDRLGEVVALAVGRRFPPIDPRDRYEHGSITEDEMLVPLGVWAPEV